MRTERWLVVSAIGVYALSLALPAIRGAGFPSLSGVDVLRRGASAWELGVVSWYANPALWLSWLALWLGRWRLGLGLAALGLGLALSSFAAGALAEHAGRSVPPFSFAPGFYIWVAAFVAAAAAALVGIYKVSRARAP